MSSRAIAGVSIQNAGATGNSIQGNYVGIGTNGTLTVGNSGSVVTFGGGAANNTIGGTAAGAGNVIAFNNSVGVVLYSDAGTGNAIYSNSIYSNFYLGIDLGADGVTPNDPGDADVGPNNLQNYPVLDSAVSSDNNSGGQNQQGNQNGQDQGQQQDVKIRGTLNSSASAMFTLQFFSNTACDPSGFGEGEVFIGSTIVTTDNHGNAHFNTTFATPADTLPLQPPTPMATLQSSPGIRRSNQATDTPAKRGLLTDIDTMNCKIARCILPGYLAVHDGYP